MSIAAISGSPASIIPDLIAAEMVGGGSAGDASSPAGDAASFSAQAVAMLAAEQSALASVMGAMPS
jgi:hypothetical protein